MDAQLADAFSWGFAMGFVVGAVLAVIGFGLVMTWVWFWEHNWRKRN